MLALIVQPKLTNRDTLTETDKKWHTENSNNDKSYYLSSI